MRGAVKNPHVKAFEEAEVKTGAHAEDGVTGKGERRLKQTKREPKVTIHSATW